MQHLFTFPGNNSVVLLNEWQSIMCCSTE